MMDAYFDMACWHQQPDDWWYGRGFRLGDRAVAYIKTLHHKFENPHHRIFAYEDSSYPECAHVQEFDAHWLFDGLAEVADRSIKPEGIRLYDEALWAYWRELKYYRPVYLEPRIKPKDENMALAYAMLDTWGICEPYIVVHPLVDAYYNEYRNKSPEWWAYIIDRLAIDRKVVVVGTPAMSELFTFHNPNVIEAYATGMSAMTSLALIYKSSLFIGSETGLTLWAPILQVPTIGLTPPPMTEIRYETFYCEPISFGAPLITHPNKWDIEILIDLINKFIHKYKC